MKFRKRAKLFSGVYLNFSKSGISTTIGGPGVSVNFNKKGAFLNTGIPGTGLYDRQKIGSGEKGNQNLPIETPAEIQLIEKVGTIKSEEYSSRGGFSLGSYYEVKKSKWKCFLKVEKYTSKGMSILTGTDLQSLLNLLEQAKTKM